MQKKPQIRQAKPKDVDGIMHLMQEFASQLEDHFVLNIEKEVFSKQLTDENFPFNIFVAEAENKIVGYAAIIFQFSIWKGKFYLYLDDIYIQPVYRSLGIGQEMMNRIKEEALQKGCEMVKWEVQIHNESGRKFYENLGANYREAGLFQWDLG